MINPCTIAEDLLIIINDKIEVGHIVSGLIPSRVQRQDLFSRILRVFGIDRTRPANWTITKMNDREELSVWLDGVDYLGHHGPKDRDRNG